MNDWSAIGKAIILAGVVLVIIGLAVLFKDKLPLGMGRLPGDITIERDNFRFYFPLGTSIVISIILTLIFSIWKK
ncbi:DUF2905 domain-containing protein [Desulfonatronovibrio hydrogenovorans]|uniref:DUF2905 domain-containing protein n=1 Tax=Desulfonatronovibrio hydrogenovorans TaxID=53245 RepID=UPI0004910FEA|nr:DUF2905 domain-containing protein [Desulfonatronovibrio hydrogenovorans]